MKIVLAVLMMATTMCGAQQGMYYAAQDPDWGNTKPRVITEGQWKALVHSIELLDKLDNIKQKQIESLQRELRDLRLALAADGERLKLLEHSSCIGAACAQVNTPTAVKPVKKCVQGGSLAPGESCIGAVLVAPVSKEAGAHYQCLYNYATLSADLQHACKILSVVEGVERRTE